MELLRARLAALDSRGAADSEPPPGGGGVTRSGVLPSGDSGGRRRPPTGGASALQLRVCGSQIEGHVLMSVLDESAGTPHGLCRFIERKLGLAKIEQLELLDTAGPRFVPLVDTAQLGDRATVRVAAATEGQRPFPYTVHDAAADGDVAACRQMIASGADASSRSGGLARPMGQTALHAAASQPSVEVMSALLQTSIDACATDRVGRSALHVAATHGHAEVAAALAFAEPRLLRITTQSGSTPLHEACYHGHTGVVDALCAAHADINAEDDGGRLPLHWAAERGHAEAAAMLMAHALRMKHSLDPTNATDNLGRSALHLACLNGFPAVAAVLISHGADLDALDTIGHTAMELAGMANDSMRDPTGMGGRGAQAEQSILGHDHLAPSRTGRLATPQPGQPGQNVGRQLTDVTHDPRLAENKAGWPIAREENPAVVAARGHLGCVTLLLQAGAKAPAAG
eukprot:COSAG04_NODE_44_length_31776_cov_9.320769_16_plen_457_part_00